MSLEIIEESIDEIVKEYLFNISSLKDHNYFNTNYDNEQRNKNSKYYGFDILYRNTKNNYVVREENFLEGCTRVFLINPIIKYILDYYNILNDWKFGDTFADFTISNKEYELGNFLEFIAILNGEKVGIRYTELTYSSSDISIPETMNRDYNFIFKHTEIPGFEVLKTVDKVYSLIWVEASNTNYKNSYPHLPGKSFAENISIEEFFLQYFSKELFNLIIKKSTDAVKKANDIIALSSVPQLLPNNMLHFKKYVLENFSKSEITSLKYEFEDGTMLNEIPIDDINIMNHIFFDLSNCKALIGTKDFAKSLITSEYLFSIIKEGLSIDYTSVAVGYLKAVEQLLYLIYISAFEGKSRLVYWDKCNKTQSFDISNSEKYRYDPYNIQNSWKQEKYSHKMKTGDNAPEFGELIRFLRYYDKLWRISETGKEFVFKCLDDFRDSCRNSHFHKDNIEASQYNTVKRIRNNAFLCLFYLLSGFKLLDPSKPEAEQLGIVDYSFDFLYQEIRQKRRRFFSAKSDNGEEFILCYLNDDKNIFFNESGMLADAQLKFLKINTSKDNIYLDEVSSLLNDEQFLRENTIFVSRNNIPKNIKAIFILKNPKDAQRYMKQ